MLCWRSTLDLEVEMDATRAFVRRSVIKTGPPSISSYGKFLPKHDVRSDFQCA